LVGHRRLDSHRLSLAILPRQCGQSNRLLEDALDTLRGYKPVVPRHLADTLAFHGAAARAWSTA
jgi:hypothetical protein